MSGLLAAALQVTLELVKRNDIFPLGCLPSDVIEIGEWIVALHVREAIITDVSDTWYVFRV